MFNALLIIGGWLPEHLTAPANGPSQLNKNNYRWPKPQLLVLPSLISGIILDVRTTIPLIDIRLSMSASNIYK